MCEWDTRDEELRRELGLALAQRRIALGLSGGVVGRVAGVSHTTISRIECGQYVPVTDLFHRIGAALGMDAGAVRWLLEDIDYQQKLLAAVRTWGARNRGPLQALLSTLGEQTMDEVSAAEFTRDCLRNRRSIEERAAEPVA